MAGPSSYSWPLVTFPPPPAPEINGVPILNPGQTTLPDLIRIIRQRTDTVNNQIVTDDELTDNIRLSANELYDLLIGAYEDYAVVLPPYTLTTDGTTDFYSLPVDVYKILSIEPVRPGFPYSPPLKRFNRNSNEGWLPFLPGFPGINRVRYKLTGNKLEMRPRPPSGLQYLIYYVPRLRPLSNVGSFTFNFSAGSPPLDSYVGITRYLNGESDGGATWTAKASDLGPGTFQVDFTSAENTAANLATAINRDADPASYRAYASGKSVGVVLASPAGLQLSGSVRGYLCNPGYQFTNILDGFSGWEQYIISDVGAQVQQKQDLDVTVFAAQKLALKQRIEKMAVNRDAGTPATVTDVYADDCGPFGYGMGDGYGGWGIY